MLMSHSYNPDCSGRGWTRRRHASYVLFYTAHGGQRQNQVDVSRTYHSPHTVCGGRANRVVVGVGCCIDSAVAAQREAQRTRSLIHQQRGEQNIYARLFNAQALQSTLSSLERNQFLPLLNLRGSPTLYKVVEKGEFKGW